MHNAPERLDVTVIIPAYNRAGMIGRTLDSILNQTRHPARVIVVDDASSDNTVEAVMAWSRRHAFPVSVEAMPVNAGAGAARNHGMTLATTRYIAFLDSDDEHCPRTLELLVSALEADPGAVLSFGDGMVISSETDKVPNGIFGRRVKLDQVAEFIGTDQLPVYRLRDAKTTMLRASMIPTSATCFLRTAALDVGGMPAEFRMGQDWLFWLRLMEKGNFVLIPDDLSVIHRQSDNLTNSANNAARMRGKLVAFSAMLDGSFKLHLTPAQRDHVHGLIKEVEREWRYQLSTHGLPAYLKGIAQAKPLTGSGLAGHLAADPKSLLRAVFRMLVRPVTTATNAHGK